MSFKIFNLQIKDIEKVHWTSEHLYTSALNQLTFIYKCPKPVNIYIQVPW